MFKKQKKNRAIQSTDTHRLKKKTNKYNTQQNEHRGKRKSKDVRYKTKTPQAARNKQTTILNFDGYRQEFSIPWMFVNFCNGTLSFRRTREVHKSKASCLLRVFVGRDVSIEHCSTRLEQCPQILAGRGRRQIKHKACAIRLARRTCRARRT